MEPELPIADASVAGCIDRRIWGKSADSLDRPYPLICHLIDTAAIAGALFDILVGVDRTEWFANQLKVDPGSCRAQVMLWAGLHDIGKISIPFQSYRPKLGGALWSDPAYVTPRQTEGDKKLAHDKATQLILAELLPMLGYSDTIDGSGHLISQLLGRHHGRIHSAQEEAIRYRTPLGDGEWQRQRLLHLKTLQALVGVGADAAPSQRASSAAVAVVSGLVVCADWLASQESFIIAGKRLPDLAWEATPENLEAHWRTSLNEALEVVREAGLDRARFHPIPSTAVGFQERFRFAPNSLQMSLLADLPKVATGPGLLLVTAPPGDGKTEASQLAVLHFHAVAHTGGFAYVLPTMATTDAMFRRAQRFADANLSDQAALGLLHGMAWLNTDFDTLAKSTSDDAGTSEVLTGEAEDRVFATDWLRAGRRGILAPLGAMTIDQVLTGVLPVKHNLLRLFGMHGKTVVIDEAHSYGPWMHSLLVRFLEWLAALRVPVVVMSATLTGRTAADLINAYRRGVLGRRAVPVDVAPPYPGWLFVDGLTGDVAEPRQVGTARPSRLHVERECVAASAESVSATVPDRLEAIGRVLIPLAVEGGCVLVCCNTVAAAQAAYDFLVGFFAQNPEAHVRVDLLHSRFQAGDRGRITSEVEALYGKPDDSGESLLRPGASVLVATQIVEQSIDLDFDLVITDLAPLALLIQRAGRGRRHARRSRPSWTDPAGGARHGEHGGTAAEPPISSSRLVVLEPVTESGEFEKPKQWGSVYFENLLMRTSTVLRELRTGAIDIPADVQGLVDEVYAHDFVERREAAEKQDLKELRDADREHLAAVLTESQLAKNVAIQAPKPKARDLASELGGSQLAPGMEEFVVTRLGADSARALLVFEQADGGLTLDIAGELQIEGRNDLQRIRSIMSHVVPVPGAWLRDHDSLVELPTAWAKNLALHDLTIVRGRPTPQGGWRSTALPRLSYDSQRGLSRE